MQLAFRLCWPLLAFLTCLQFQHDFGANAYVPPQRCMCPQTNLLILEPIQTFSITESHLYCQKDEIIVTLKKDNLEVCLNPDGKQGQRLLRCWKKINKDENLKKTCIKHRRK